MIAAMREELELDAAALAHIQSGLAVGNHRQVQARYQSFGERAARLATLTGENEGTVLLNAYQVIEDNE